VGYESKFFVSYRCPYWDLKGTRLAVGNGYCHFLEKGDFDYDPHMLHLWDELKACGINNRERTSTEVIQRRLEFYELSNDYIVGGKNSNLIEVIKLLLKHLRGKTHE
jgi:hypothetical protein